MFNFKISKGMKKMKVLAVAIIALLSTASVFAQEFTAKADLVSSYVWRGTIFSGASVQPSLTFTTGGLSVGAWGSTGLKSTSTGLDLYNEMDLFASYATSFGLTVGLTDYYYPGSSYFAGASHALEANLGYTVGKLSLAANYIPFAAATAGSVGGDMYLEAGLNFDNFGVFVGAGNGWHTSDAKFDFCNIGIKSTKSIKITDSFSVPLTGSVILNPEKKQFYIVAAISL